MEIDKDYRDKDKDRKSTVRQSVQFAKPKLGSRQTSASTTQTTGKRYEELPVGKPPLPITVAPRPSSARIENHPSFRDEPSSPEPPLPSLPASFLDGSISSRQFKLARHDSRRDSAIAVFGNILRDSHVTATTTSTFADEASTSSIKKSRSLPRMNSDMASTAAHTAEVTSSPGSKPRARLAKKQSRDVTPAPVQETPFVGLTTDIPSVAFGDLMEPEKIEFSKRGSMLIGEKMMNDLRNLRGIPRGADPLPTTNIQLIRALSPEEEAMSYRVRSMYHTGVAEMPVVPEGESVGHAEGAENVPERATASPEPQSIRVVSAMSGNVAGTGFVATSLRGSVIREEHELAGGYEDWQDVEGGDVDRYGFISPRPAPGTASVTSLASSHGPHLHRVSTQLQLASETRRGSSRLGRSPSNGKSIRSAQDLKANSARERTIRPMSSQSSYRSTGSSSSRLRTATNRLPHNRSRRIMDEAGDMLTLPPGLADIAAAKDDGRTSARQKAKEWEREGKWRKMARMTRREKGGGMTFTFDTRDPKVISRTWKGIPDRWRASAWQSFLATSARKRGGQPTDAELKDAFLKLQDIPSPDDMQIDTDVPRTIGAHIMFRTRYRGGQRLLFRVLHALSLFFPETGYVQGMAALAATLLCYFDETATFTMLVRLWMLRGLDRLYSPGFGGLMTALDELDRHWMAGGEVGAKLHELGIAPTSFGTRWYLTLFNYSIPFPAQLRVWDVFFLLGDPEKPYPMPITALEWLKDGGRKDTVETKIVEAAIPASTETVQESKAQDGAKPEAALEKTPSRPATAKSVAKSEKEKQKEEKARAKQEKKEQKEKKKAKKAPLHSAAVANKPRKASTQPSEPEPAPEAKPEPETETKVESKPEPEPESKAPPPAVSTAETPAPRVTSPALDRPTSPALDRPNSPGVARPMSPTSFARTTSPALRATSPALAPGPSPALAPSASADPTASAAPASAPARVPAAALAPGVDRTPPSSSSAAPLPEVPVPAPTKAPSAPSSAGRTSATKGKRPQDSFHGGLDVLHATSAALVDATREILLDSDFENAMKTLTSWVPVQDEELLMKVAMAEYRRGRRRRGAR